MLLGSATSLKKKLATAKIWVPGIMVNFSFSLVSTL